MLKYIVLLSMLTSTLCAIEIEEIVQKLEENQTFATSYMTATMVVHDRFGSREIDMEIYSRGADYSLIEFTSAAERGQKVLRTDEEIYLFFPDAAELIRLQGAALRESMVGSDISYEDVTGGKDIMEKYEFSLLGTETYDDREVYRVEMVARTRNVPYPRQMLLVDTERFITLSSELYAANGRLLKTIASSDVEEVAGKYVATRALVTDKLRKKTSTNLQIHTIEVDIPLEDSLFSLDELTW